MFDKHKLKFPLKVNPMSHLCRLLVYLLGWEGTGAVVKGSAVPWFLAKSYKDMLLN